MKKLFNNDQLDLLAKTMVDVGKLVFAALVLAQIFSEQKLNVFLFGFGVAVLSVLTTLGILTLNKRIWRNEQWKRDWLLYLQWHCFLELALTS